jgi:two-component system, OmpR family, sensor histidine kinase KdpD
MTALIHSIPGAARIANISMLYLLVVIAAALGFGSGPAILASVLAFFAFDWFFVEPLYHFTVADPAEWLALLMFLVTAVIIGQLTARLRDRVEEARRRERETAALAEASWAVASQVDRDRALAEVLRRIAEVVSLRAAAILVEDDTGRPELIAGCGEVSLPDFSGGTAREALQLVLSEGKPVAWGGDRRHWRKALAGPSSPFVPGSGPQNAPSSPAARPAVAYLPLSMADREVPPQERRVVESLANHAAVVLERDRLTRSATAAQALAEADRLKTALLSMVSHDFRSPLAAIKASVTGLLQEGTPWELEAQRELLQGIDHETDRLNRMVGSILALSRLEADAWQPQCEPTSPVELVGAALDAFGADDNRRIQVTLNPSLAELWLDLPQMVQVLSNLVDNALKYSPPGSPIELHAFPQERGAVLQVLDRGRGLLKGEEQRVFKPFYRAPGLQESAVPGMGIGLAVCRGLVEAHGGQLTVYNREGGGAVFQIRLPAPLHRRDAEDAERARRK